jgi:hypothetical protein
MIGRRHSTATAGGLLAPRARPAPSMPGSSPTRGSGGASPGPEKSPMARKVHPSFMKLQALAGGRDNVAKSAYPQLLTR